MSVTSKSPLGVAREALAVGSATLRDYAHRFSPKTYTQPQLFACLVLKTFLKTDYRGICRILSSVQGPQVTKSAPRMERCAYGDCQIGGRTRVSPRADPRHSRK